ncbi:peroxidase family protein [Gordonia sp. CPCC 206044]|uniref:peroxidase family protein n=1 Tax=Gordonia sp. CPCC 206044 TaxID=3140793 RepID=UPI003AF376C6
MSLLGGLWSGGSDETDRRPILTRTLAGTAERIDGILGWSNLPLPLGVAILVGLRSQLRAKNLFDTGSHPAGPLPAGTIEEYRARTVPGTYNDVAVPRIGSTGSRFGRNIPLDRGFPETEETILEPNPRLVSLTLLDRREFRPAESLNLLAAAWIQFEVHDWFNHRVPPNEPDRYASWEIPRPPGDPFGTAPITFPRNEPIAGAEPHHPPTHTTTATFWWDGSQIYGDDPAYAEAIRLPDGQIDLDEVGLPPVETDDLLDKEGPAANFWVGLALIHSLFLREHNAICRRLITAYPHMSGQEVYDTARLVNCALMAKIHTVDWTPAIIAHPTTAFSLRGNWFGLLGEKFANRWGHVVDNELISGIPGSRTQSHGVPFSLTEEFVAIYRMHPLMPDDIAVRDLATDEVKVRHPIADVMVGDVRKRLGEASMADLLYSFGRAHPGSLSLHNFPGALQNLARPIGDPIDLATIDIMRVRERGVPRYNEFRELLRLAPASDFLELTGGDVTAAAELEGVYGHVDDVDLMIGLYAEPKPDGFGFSDTAFRLFILMASRRLSCDRFFTDGLGPGNYTEVGMTWLRTNSMRTLLLRHFPTLAPALAGVANPFAPWHVPNRDGEDAPR